MCVSYSLPSFGFSDLIGTIRAYVHVGKVNTGPPDFDPRLKNRLATQCGRTHPTDAVQQWKPVEIGGH